MEGSNISLKTLALGTFFFVAIMGLIVLSLSGDINSEVLMYQALAPTDSPAEWNIGGTFATNMSISNASIPESRGSDILRLSATFEEGGLPKVYMVYTFDKPLNLLNYDMIVFWLYADSSVGQEGGSFSLATSAPYGYAIYLFDDVNSHKGLNNIPICWMGWNRIAIPLRFQSNNVSSSWSDDVGLGMIKSLRIDLIAFDAIDEHQHNLHINSIEVLKVNRFVVNDILGLALSSMLIVAAIIITPYVALVFCEASNNRILMMVKGALAFLKSGSLQTVFVVAVLLKSALAFMSPLSSDFINIVYGVTSAFPFSNIFAASPSSGGVWITIMHSIYKFWSLFPVDHPEVITIYPGSGLYPSMNTPIYYFLSTPGSFLLVLMMKVFFIIFDVVTAFIVSRIVVLISGSQKLGIASFVVWLLNPYTFLIVQMWGSMDIIMVCFLMLSAYLFYKGRRDLSAIALGISIGTKLFPIVLLPVYLIHVRKMKHATSQFSNLSNNNNVNLASLRFITISLTTFFISLTPNLLLGPSREGILKVIPDLNLMPDFSFFLGPILEVFGFRISITVVLFILYLTVLSLPNYGGHLSFQESLLGAILVLFAFSYWHPQFILWIIPFMVIDAYTSRQRKLFFPLFMVITFAIAISFFGFYLSTCGNSFFFILNYTPQLATLSRQLWTIGSSEAFQLSNGTVLLQSVFSGLSLSYLISIITQKPKPAEKPT